eukprot:m.64220 g.64220  ORF g.64220 m.64220 type:complete len:54 (-) comp11475_c0_seq18:760-921(-)
MHADEYSFLNKEAAESMMINFASSFAIASSNRSKLAVITSNIDYKYNNCSNSQ